MRKAKVFAAAAAALILVGAAGWAVSNSQARVPTPTTVQIDTISVMTSAKNLPTEQFDDYSFVFN